MKINQYDVLNSNASGHVRACVRVKLNQVILIELRSDHSNPLKWLRIRPQSEERKEFLRQARLNEISEADIAMLLRLPETTR